MPARPYTGDDGNYGSSAVCDTECLQALSKRIHYGKFIAEVCACATPLSSREDTHTASPADPYHSMSVNLRTRSETLALQCGADTEFGAHHTFPTTPPQAKFCDPDWHDRYVGMIRRGARVCTPLRFVLRARRVFCALSYANCLAVHGSRRRRSLRATVNAGCALGEAQNGHTISELGCAGCFSAVS